MAFPTTVTLVVAGGAAFIMLAAHQQGKGLSLREAWRWPFANRRRVGTVLAVGLALALGPMLAVTSLESALRSGIPLLWIAGAAVGVVLWTCLLIGTASARALALLGGAGGRAATEDAIPWQEPPLAPQMVPLASGGTVVVVALATWVVTPNATIVVVLIQLVCAVVACLVVAGTLASDAVRSAARRGVAVQVPGATDDLPGPSVGLGWCGAVAATLPAVVLAALVSVNPWGLPVLERVPQAGYGTLDPLSAATDGQGTAWAAQWIPGADSLSLELSSYDMGNWSDDPEEVPWPMTQQILGGNAPFDERPDVIVEAADDHVLVAGTWGKGWYGRTPSLILADCVAGTCHTVQTTTGSWVYDSGLMDLVLAQDGTVVFAAVEGSELVLRTWHPGSDSVEAASVAELPADVHSGSSFTVDLGLAPDDSPVLLTATTEGATVWTCPDLACVTTEHHDMPTTGVSGDSTLIDGTGRPLTVWRDGDEVVLVDCTDPLCRGTQERRIAGLPLVEDDEWSGGIRLSLVDGHPIIVTSGGDDGRLLVRCARERCAS
ncbi:hypothetical protein [Cellulomonas sp. NPDC089187]|uniref:hypothetical protein n=1 Tax=Cellulomonas sp. NPDC089187 TaxID=3154970 RepID=UPI00343A4A5D